MCSILVMQAEQHVIYRLMEGVAREAQDDREETDGEQLPCVKADNCPPTRSTWRSGVRSM